MTQLKAVLRRRGGCASDVEVRAWIEKRDTSGTGAVDFADFSRAFELSSQFDTNYSNSDDNNDCNNTC